MEAVPCDVLQSTQQPVGIVVQPLGVLNGGVQELTGVYSKAHGIVGVALRIQAEVSKAGTFVGTVTNVGGSQHGVLLRGPAGCFGTAGVKCCFGGNVQRLQNFLTLAELQAGLTVPVGKSEALNVGTGRFVEGEGSSVGSVEVERSFGGVRLTLLIYTETGPSDEWWTVPDWSPCQTHAVRERNGPHCLFGQVKHLNEPLKLFLKNELLLCSASVTELRKKCIQS